MSIDAYEVIGHHDYVVADAVTGPALRVVDRSTLENYATCPSRGVLLESGRVLNSSKLADAGSAVHDAFSAVVQLYLDFRGELSGADLRNEVRVHLQDSRPDIQPDAIRGGNAAVYAWVDFLKQLKPHAVLRFDGGEGQRTGQLAYDLPLFGLRITSELDLLVATASAQVVEEIDYKSGYRPWTEADVFDSFQFQLHALLIFHNYPAVECVRIRVWSTRFNRLTYAAEFYRDKHLEQITARVESAAGEYAAYTGLQQAPTWPSLEKCPKCPAAALCPAAAHVREFAADAPSYIDELKVLEANATYWTKLAETAIDGPDLFIVRLGVAIEKVTAKLGKVLGDKAAGVQAMAALESRLSAMRALAAQYADERGDIVTSDGTAFGRSKPPSTRKPMAQLYSVKGGEEETE